VFDLTGSLSCFQHVKLPAAGLGLRLEDPATTTGGGANGGNGGGANGGGANGGGFEGRIIAASNRVVAFDQERSKTARGRRLTLF
jgi:hypothetical protein